MEKEGKRPEEDRKFDNNKQKAFNYRFPLKIKPKCTFSPPKMQLEKEGNEKAINRIMLALFTVQFELKIRTYNHSL